MSLFRSFGRFNCLYGRLWCSIWSRLPFVFVLSSSFSQFKSTNHVHVLRIMCIMLTKSNVCVYKWSQFRFVFYFFVEWDARRTFFRTISIDSFNNDVVCVVFYIYLYVSLCLQLNFASSSFGFCVRFLEVIAICRNVVVFICFFFFRYYEMII